MRTLGIIEDDIQLNIVDGDKEIKQSLERILTTRIHEWFLNTTFGLDHESIIKKPIESEQIELVVREALLQDERVVEVLSIGIEVDRKTRKAIISFSARTKETIIESEVTL